MGDPIRCAPGTGVVALECPLARSQRELALFITLSFVRLVGESRLSSRRFPGKERRDFPYRVLRDPLTEMISHSATLRGCYHKPLARSWRNVLVRTFLKKLDEIQPSQLFISSEKLSKVMDHFNPPVAESLEPIPIKYLDGYVIFTDGHTRALVAFLSGQSEIVAYWDEDELDWEVYSICVDWCREEGIYTIADLIDRVIPPNEYENLWYDRCQAMQKGLEEKRNQKKTP